MFADKRGSAECHQPCPLRLLSVFGSQPFLMCPVREQKCTTDCSVCGTVCPTYQQEVFVTGGDS